MNTIRQNYVRFREWFRPSPERQFRQSASFASKPQLRCLFTFIKDGKKINDIIVEKIKMILVHKKFVNDISASERLVRNGGSDMQSNLDCITSCSSQNFMKISGMKCKEMQVCFLWETPELSPRVINGQILGNSTLT